MNIKAKLEKLEKVLNAETLKDFLTKFSFPIVIVGEGENEREKTEAAYKEECNEIMSRLNISEKKANELIEKYNLTPFVIRICNRFFNKM